jgi:hypothetical protein
MYSTSSSYSGDGASAAILAMTSVIWVVYLAVLVVVIAGMWKVFVKAGQPGWAAIVPIYNMIILVQIVGRPIWWVALLFASIIPCVGWIVALAAGVILMNDLSKSFGQSTGFTVGLILLSPVFVPILGFGGARYIGPMATGFGNPPTTGGGGYGGPGAPGGYTPPAPGGYTPPAPGGYTPPASGGYVPPTPPAPPAPTYAPPAAPAAPAPTYQPPAPPAAPAPTYQPPAAPPATPEAPPAAPPAPPAPPA